MRMPKFEVQKAEEPLQDGQAGCSYDDARETGERSTGEYWYIKHQAIPWPALKAVGMLITKCTGSCAWFTLHCVFSWVVSVHFHNNQQISSGFNQIVTLVVHSP